MPTATSLSADPALLSKITDRAFAQMVMMIWEANNRKDKQTGDPKVGGHPAACASSMQILSALHLAVRDVEDYVCCKPHASPVDHALHHLLGLFRRPGDDWLSEEESKAVMSRLRKFPEPGAEDVFQSYHARTDPDSFHFLPSGSVGIPPVASVYLALAHRYLRDHGLDVPDPHFWSLIGDSEFREGSLLEAMPDAAERLLGNVTWIIDYNRQNLDGTRIPNEKGLHSRDCDRIQRTAEANGWRVIQVRHGKFREELFARPGGDVLRRLFEAGFSDYDFQVALFKRDAELMRALARTQSEEAAKFLEKLPDEEVVRAFGDLGGHDMELMIESLHEAKQDPETPTLVIVHTVKGEGLSSYADPSNHSTLPDEQEITAILEARGLSFEDPYECFDPASDEGGYLAERGAAFRAGMQRIEARARERRAEFKQRVLDVGGLPESLEIDLSLYPKVHTQWMWGQIAAKLVRIGTLDDGGPILGGKPKPLNANEERWNSVADLLVTLSPDVGTSTNIAPLLDQRVYGPSRGGESEPVFDARHPELFTQENPWTRHIRFEIAEANCMSAAGSFGKMVHYTGVPTFPIMTVYDFFIKRALDQLYYNLYWGSEFVIIGTPSGVTLAPEGAQHSWKSDIQIPNLITWEPFYAAEMDWILADAIKRHMLDDNDGRRGVLVRAVTRAIDQRELLTRLRRHADNKVNLEGALLAPAGAEWEDAVDESTLEARPDAEILGVLREDVLAGGYFLVDWRGYAGYTPGDNVIHLVAMGSVATEAVAAADVLLEHGILANVIVVSSPELMFGILGHQDDYRHLREDLGVNGDLHAAPSTAESTGELISIAGRRVPIVAICDGEAGLLDNIGSIVGVKQITLAVRKFSKSGRPDQVYRYQGLDSESIVDAAGRALSETALEDLRVAPELLERLAGGGRQRPDWRELWKSNAGAGRENGRADNA
ncbi:MAG: pyruvate dehydrogenase [Planctomycetota bacterium]